VQELRKKYPLANFEVVDTLDEAHIVIYFEHGYVGLADLPRLLRRIRYTAPFAMHFLYSESDWPFPVLPGAYASLSKPFRWAQSWSYVPRFVTEITDMALLEQDDPEFLFSFLGRISTHPMREKVQLLDSAHTPCLDVKDASLRFPSFDYSRSYVELLRRSKFVLCPRGFGASSIRIFEAMSLGRVPVIISDQWHPPGGISWKDFCIFVPERQVSSIPAMLSNMKSKAHEMGQLARKVFDESFAPDVFLERLLTTLVSSYSSCSFSSAATCERAWRALGWREIRSLSHQGRSHLLDYVRQR
jgi:hypothetical protein